MKHSSEKHIHKNAPDWFNRHAEERALDALINNFTKELKLKLIEKRNEGKSGWDDPEWSEENIRHQLIEHIAKGDMLDVAAFAMFLWNRKVDP